MEVRYPKDSPIVGILFLLAGEILFSVQDVLIRSLSGAYPVFEILFFRAIAAIIPCLILVHYDSGFASLKTKRIGIHLLRSFLMLLSYMFFYLGLAALPLADTMALFYASPFFVTILSILVLGEQITFNRWFALLTGFTGVLIILHPGFGIFNPAAILILLAASTYAGAVMITRRMADTESASVMVVYLIVFSFFVSGGFGLLMNKGILVDVSHPSLDFLIRQWKFPTWPDLIKMIAMGGIAAIGLYCLTQAYRVAKSSIIAPFEYCGIIPATFWGFMIWNEIPPPTTLVGIIFIISSGIYLVRLERR